MFFYLIFISWQAISLPQADKNSGMKVVTRHTFAGHSSETILYKTLDKRRTEIRNSI
jgi:hypothetical protein